MAKPASTAEVDPMENFGRLPAESKETPKGRPAKKARGQVGALSFFVELHSDYGSSLLSTCCIMSLI